MSSKSRKQSSGKRASARTPSAQAPSAKEHVKIAGLDVPDEYVDVHKERHPLVFLLIVALMVFLLIIFIIPGAMLKAAGGGGSKGISDFVSWTIPIQGVPTHEKVDSATFLQRKIAISKVLEIDPFLLLPLGIVGGRSAHLEDEDYARLMLLDRLAETSGVLVPREAMARHLAEIVKLQFQSTTQYKAYFASGRDRLGTRGFEEELTRMMGVNRFITMLGDIPEIADPQGIEESWHKDHVAERFEYLTLDVAPIQEEVAKETVDDATLETWLKGLEDFQRERYKTPERRVITFAYVADPTATPAKALLDRYPEPEEVAPEERAKEYYNRVFFNRFERPPASGGETGDKGSDASGGDDQKAGTDDQATGGDEKAAGGDDQKADGNDPATGGDDPAAGGDGQKADGGDPAAGADDPATADDDQKADGNEPAAGGDDQKADDAQEPPSQFYDFEEVKDRAMREAPFYFALEAWLKDLQKRVSDGEKVDLAKEAADMGLAVETTEPLSDEELRDRSPLGGATLASAVAGTSEGSLCASLFVDPTEFGIFQVDSVVAPTIPPLSEIRERVHEDWVADEARNRALDRLSQVREAFPELPPDEAESTDGSDAKKDQPKPKDEPEPGPRYQATSEAFHAAAKDLGLEVGVRDWLDRARARTDDPDATDPAHVFLASNQDARDAKVDEVIAPALDGSREHAFLVRKDGERPVPIENMTPLEYQTYKQRSALTAGSTVRQAFTDEYLKKQFQLAVVSESQKKPPEDPRAGQ